MRSLLLLTQAPATFNRNQVGLWKLEEPKGQPGALPILERFTLKNAPPAESMF